jgi:NTP pyrophosphatase (non-canonical NTP hydrolase)
MNLKQFVLAKIAEECTEVAKRAIKQMQFGEHQHDAGFEPNMRRLQEETTDLAMWVGIAEKLGIAYPTGNIYSRYRAKRDKIIRVLHISVVEGQVDPAVLDYFTHNEDLLP